MQFNELYYNNPFHQDKITFARKNLIHLFFSPNKLNNMVNRRTLQIFNILLKTPFSTTQETNF